MEKILIIDDDEDVCTTLEALIKVHVGEVECFNASNGVQALEIFRKHRISVIVTDFRMPKMDGFTFLLQVRKMDPVVPVILITGHVDDLNEAITLDSHTVVLPKPLSDDRLGQGVANILKGEKLADARKILLIDEFGGLHFVLGHLLGSLSGVRLFKAHSVEEGCASFSAHGDVDLLVAELRSTLRDGLKLTQTVHELHPGTPMIFVSSDEIGLKQLRARVPLTATFANPFDSVELLRKIEDALASLPKRSLRASS